MDDCVAVSQPAGENIRFVFGSRSEGRRHISLLPVSIPSLSSLSTPPPLPRPNPNHHFPPVYEGWCLYRSSAVFFLLLLLLQAVSTLNCSKILDQVHISLSQLCVHVCVTERENECMQSCCYMAVSLLTALTSLQFFTIFTSAM